MQQPAFAGPGIANPFSLEAAAATDVGCLRSDNQDSVFVENPPPDHREFASGLLAIVADGMGGHLGGAVASALAVDAFASSFHNAGLNEAPADILARSLQAANTVVFERAETDPALRGMGTTLSALLLRSGKLYAVHVGDSRIYRVSADGLSQLSEDHSLVNELLRKGVLSPESAPDFPDRNVLTQALGTKPTTGFDVWPVEPDPRIGDTFLLCSDGLHDLVTPDQMLEVLQSKPPAAACRTLIDLARMAGGPDNISAVVIAVRDPVVASPAPRRTGDILIPAGPP